MSEFIVTEVQDGIARITLNRPRAINALTEDMFTAMYDALTAWHDDDAVTAVELAGNGERGFCAGADVRALVQLVRDGGPFLQYLETEYALDMMLANYPKPVTSFLRGVSMGGGLGIGAHVGRRIVYADTVMAMPETKIGFFPDAGVMHELSRAGAVGKHVALTSGTFTGAAVETRYGAVQVEITVEDGVITSSEAIKYPNRDRHDQQINAYAVPVLNAEALDAQSADIDSVSGATFTSVGYAQSLQSAIDEAFQ